jgi:glycosyltransferase involved in cell wall biosynthesis
MIQSNIRRVSIVIPVYNEAPRLGACLEAIALQTAAPYEVIVVDNNSSDGTREVAARYGFVTVLREPKQGVVHARNRGFDAARGEIIGRIDADTLLPAGWVAQVQAIFEDPGVSAVSGAPYYYDFPLTALAHAMDWPLRARLARKLGGTNFLWGANMAVRRRDWLRVRSRLCSGHRLHEDFDLGIHLQQHGLAVAYDDQLLAGVSSRRVDSRFVPFVRYTLVSPRTYALHGLRSRYHMYPMLFICWACHLPARLMYRAYNPKTQSYSLSQLFSVGSGRVDPTANTA